MKFCIQSTFAAALGLLACVAAYGCGDNRPARVPVSGRVLIDGKPLTIGSVRFVPAKGRMSTGVLDSDGRFTLTCFENNDGAVPGLHQVAVNGLQRFSDWEVRWHAPKKYMDERTSGLTQEISRPTEDVVINLTWAGKQPFTEIDEGAKPKPNAPGGGSYKGK
jgi:hypothetical protein